MLLSKKEIPSIVKEVINRYFLTILKNLGFKEKPQNLSVKIGDTYDHALGICIAFFTDQDCKKELTEAVVVLYPSNITWIKIMDWLWIPRLCMFSRKLLEQKVLYVLAHELRHYWQYYTGEHKKHRKLSRFLPMGIDLLEIDAEKWAEEFLSVYGSKPRIANLSSTLMQT